MAGVPRDNPPAYYPSMLVNFRLRFDEAVVAYLDQTDPVKLPEPMSSGQTARAQLPSLAAQLSYLPLFIQGQADELSRVFARVPKTATVDLETYRVAHRFSLTFDFQTLPIDPRIIRACAVEIYMDGVQPQAFADGIATMTPPDGNSSSVLNPTEFNKQMVGLVDEWEVVSSDGGAWIELKGRDIRAIFMDQNIDKALLVALDLTKPIDDVVRQIVNRHPLLWAAPPASYVPGQEPVAPEKGKATVIVETNQYDWKDNIIPSPADVDGYTKIRIPAMNRKGAVVPEGSQGQPADNYDQSKPPEQNAMPGTEQAGGVRHSPKADTNTVSFWDVIVQYCYLVGAIPYFDGIRLKVKPAHSLYDTLEIGNRSGGNQDQNTPSPFAGAKPLTVITSEDGVTKSINYRQFVYGRDIKEYRFTRKFNGYRPRIVQVTCLDTSSKNPGQQKLLMQQWPPADDITINQPGPMRQHKDGALTPTVANNRLKHTRNQHKTTKWHATNVSPSGFQTQVDVLKYPVHGIRDPVLLERIARGIFEELMRGEQHGMLRTNNLSSFGGEFTDADVLRLKPGDLIEVLNDDGEDRAAAPLNKIWFVNATNDLATRLAGGRTPQTEDKTLAALIVASTKGILQTQSFWRVSGAKFVFRSASGSDAGEHSTVDITVNFHNFIEIRFGFPKNAGAEAGPHTALTDTIATTVPTIANRRNAQTPKPWGQSKKR